MPRIGLPFVIAVLPLIGQAFLLFLLPVLAPLLMAAAGQRPETYGLLGGAVGLGSMWFFLANHAVLPVFGPVRTLIIGLAIAGAGVLMVLSGTLAMMIVGALLIGVGYATTTPAGSQVLADFTPRTSWGLLFSLRMAAVPAGGVLAGLAGASLAGRIGWQGALQCVLAASLVIGLVLAALPRAFNESRPLKRFDARLMASPANIARPVAIIRAIAGLPSLVAAGVLLALVHSAVTSFFVIYMHAGLGVPLERAAGSFALLQGCAIVGRIVFGLLADRVGSPLPILKLLAPLTTGSALLLANFSTDWSGPNQTLCIIAIGITVGTWNGLHLAEIARVAPPDGVGEATAGAAFFTFASYMVTPPLVGWMAATIGYRPTLSAVAFAGMAALGVLIWRDRAEQ